MIRKFLTREFSIFVYDIKSLFSDIVYTIKSL